MKIDGRAIAKTIEQEVEEQVNHWKERGINISLDAVIVGEDEGSSIYNRQRMGACKRVGVETNTIKLEGNITQDELNRTLATSNAHGVLLQAPLPKGLDYMEAISHLPPEKDVEAMHPINYGKLVFQGQLVPCTPLSVMTILDRENVELKSKYVVIVNHSDILGKPLALLLLKKNATVSVVHVFTKDMLSFTKEADVLIVGAGVPNLIKGDDIKPGCVVVDVGMNRVEGKVCGDVEYTSAEQVASKITPVPGGVGPVTVASLLKNLMKCVELQNTGH